MGRERFLRTELVSIPSISPQPNKRRGAIVPLHDSIVVQILILASTRIILQYSVMQVRGRSHMELSCEN
jgi:hypothetical protein